MELTPDNLDDMDCRPLGRETGIKMSPEMEKRMATFRARTASLKSSPAKAARRPVTAE